MLCPRCNSENETGAKFCRFCGAPLTDTELFIDPKELKRREKLKKTQERKMKKEQSNAVNVPRRTYSLNEQAYQRNHLKPLLSIAKSILVLAVLLVCLYFLVGFISVKYAESSSSYSAGGNKIPSINYVLGDRDISKVERSYKEHIFKTKYIFKNVENRASDLIKYTGYLTGKSGYQFIEEFKIADETGITKLATKSAISSENMTVVEINWTKDSYTLTIYKDKNALPNTNS